MFCWSYLKKSIGNKELRSTEPNTTPFERTLISPCGNFAVGGTLSGWIEKFNIQSGASRGVYRGHTGAITGLATDASGATLISTSLDGTLRFWDFDSCKELAVIDLGTSASVLRINRDNNLIGVATDDAIIRIYDATTHKLARRFEGHTGHITDIAFSEDGRWLISAAADYTIRTWDLPSGKMIDWFSTKRAPTSIAFSPSGDFLATTHAGKLGIFLWANKAYFSSVILRRPPPLPAQMSLPSRAGPVLQSGEEEIKDSEMPPAEETEEEEEEEEMKIPKADLEAHKGYVSLSELAPAKWQNVDSLDLIKERNKPIMAKKVAEVPFFMPMVDGLDPKFAPVDVNELNNIEEEDSVKTKVMSGKNTKLLDSSTFISLINSGYRKYIIHIQLYSYS